MNNVEGKFQAKAKKIALVVSRFNEFISTKLLEGCCDCLVRHGALDKDITAIWVPGAFEIPQVAKRVSESDKFDAVITLGAIIRGGTPHFDYIANAVSRGVGACALQAKIPVVFGVLTTDTVEQAVERAGTKAGNKGWDAAMTALEMMSLLDKLT